MQVASTASDASCGVNGAPVDGAAGDEDVGERRQLFVPRRGQRSARRIRHEPGLAQQIDHGRGRLSPDAAAAAGAWARARRARDRRVGRVEPQTP